MYTEEEVRNIRDNIAIEYGSIFMDSLDLEEKMEKEARYNKNIERSMHYLKMGRDKFNGIYEFINVSAVLVVLLYVMETEHDRFEVQKMMKEYERRLEMAEMTAKTMWGPIWGLEKDPRHIEIDKRMAEYVEEVKQLLFKELLED